MTTNPSRRFLLAFAATLGALVALLTAHSILVDPYAMWGTRVVPEKGYATYGRVRVAGDRVTKAVILADNSYDTVIVGSSRPLIGFDPTHPTLKARRAYNAAFNGATTIENAGVAAFALERRAELKDLLIGIDLFAFEDVKTEADYDQSMFAGEPRWLGLVARTASKNALDGAWRFWRNVRKRTPQVTRDGFNFTPAKWLGDRRETFAAKVNGGSPNCFDVAAIAGKFDRNFAVLQPVLAQAKARGVNVYLFVSPQHVWAHFYEDAAHRTRVHEMFKLRLRKMAEDLASLPGAGRVELWDFDGLDSVTLEDVPPSGSKLDTHYFWEHSHFKTTTGNAIIAAMLGGPGGIDGFGMRLDRVDVAAHLGETRKKLEAWANTHPDDAALLRQAAMRKVACGGGKETADGDN